MKTQIRAFVNIKQAVTLQLQMFGWVPEKGVAANAAGRKTYKTAVGDRDAIAWLAHSASDNDVRLTGEYWSEGRNCLSTLFIHIPYTASDELIGEKVSYFAKQVDEQVSESYAARLWLKFGVDDSLEARRERFAALNEESGGDEESAVRNSV